MTVLRAPAASIGKGSAGVRSSEPAVLLAGVSKSFGKLLVLDGVDLAVAEHEVVCLIGASGSGKSTLLRCINLLEPIDAGRIVFQSFNLFPHMTVLDNVTIAPRKVVGRPAAEVVAEAEALLERFGMADKRNQFPDRLSGGQQQRVAIIRALAMHPDVMLLDEVTSALDPELVADVLDVIRTLADQGMTMIIATHEMGFARDIANRVGFLDAGRILEIGRPDEILGNPREERTQQFLRRVIAAGRM